MRMNQEKLTSSNGKDQLFVKTWLPEEQPKAVVQIVHGMIEHIERYHEFAECLTTQGYAVVGHDHLGHGQSVKETQAYGHFGEKEGANYLVADVGVVHQYAAACYPDRPCFILGHSMGSLVLRNYLFSQPHPLSGAIIMGTTMEKAVLMQGGKLVTNLLRPFAAQQWPYHVMEQLVFGQHNRRFRPNRTAKDWLTSDPQQVDRYLKDPYTQFHFSLAAYKDLFTLTQAASDPDQLRRIDPELPLLLISGVDDPVGHYGKSVRQLAQQLKQNADVTMYLLEQGRHEILNERNREIVYNEISRWLIEKMPK